MNPNPHDREDRACRDVDTEVFFPALTDIAENRQVIRTYCSQCPVMDMCLEWALKVEAGMGHSGRAGIYGGKTPRARAAIYRERRDAAAVKPINHGTEGGYKTHWRRGEDACQPCKTAMTLASALRHEARQKRQAS